MNTNSNTNDDSNPRLTRNRTSPRTNAFQEVIALIDTQAQTWDANLAPYAIEALTNLRTAVQAKVGTQHTDGAPKRAYTKKGDKPQTVEGNHFVGKTNNGVAVYVKGTEWNPTDYMAVFGPYNTKQGALYAIEHGTFTSKPQVF
jgi:hypothetical protein